MARGGTPLDCALYLPPTDVAIVLWWGGGANEILKRAVNFQVPYLPFLFEVKEGEEAVLKVLYP